MYSIAIDKISPCTGLICVNGYLLSTYFNLYNLLLICKLCVAPFFRFTFFVFFFRYEQFFFSFFFLVQTLIPFKECTLVIDKAGPYYQRLIFATIVPNCNDYSEICLGQR